MELVIKIKVAVCLERDYPSVSSPLSYFSSDRFGKLDHRTPEEFLKHAEKVLGKNCILFRNLEP